MISYNAQVQNVKYHKYELRKLYTNLKILFILKGFKLSCQYKMLQDQKNKPSVIS